METISELIDKLFGPPMRAVFRPTNDVFNILAPEMALILGKVLAMTLFVGAMIGVFLLRKEYVNLDRPNNARYTDLRIWTVAAMLPHVFIYLLL